MSDFSVCPMCSKPFKAPSGAGGKRGKCGHCGEVFTIPVEPPPIAPAPVAQGAPPTGKASYRPAPQKPFGEVAIEMAKAAFGIATFFALLIWLGSIHEQGVAALHYTSLLFWLGVVIWALLRRRTDLAPLIAFVGSLVVASVWFYFDYEIQRWDKSEFGKTNRYEDYVYRCNAWLFFRKFRQCPEGEYLADYQAQGGFSESGKRHGPWTWTKFNWGKDASLEDLVDSGGSFYWYGEEITEGEWHLRAAK